MDGGDARDARILIVDDEEANVRLLRRILTQAGYLTLESTTEPRRAAALYRECEPDLVLLDLHMPELDGFGVLAQLRALIPAHSYLPVLMLTGDPSPAAKEQALSAGAKDFLAKPFQVGEVVLRVRNLLETRRLHVTLQQQNETLEQRVEERTQALEAAQVEILERLAGAAEFRDDDTGQHTHRVGEVAARLARALGLPSTVVELVRRAAPLHDVGKIGIPDHILLKPGRLTADEFAVMQRHTVIGATILANGRSALIQLAERIALSHHERWDGTGYPQGLAGEAIPLEARLVSVADVFDALAHDRPYRTAWPLEDVLGEIERQSGRQFDPRVAAAFLEVADSDLVHAMAGHA